MEIGELLIRFIGSFLFAIAILYAIFFYLKRNPAAMQLVKKGPKDPTLLSVETMMALEPRKNLYIVKAGHERILLSTSPEGTQFLSKLEPPLESLDERNVQANSESIPTLLETSSQVQPMTFTPAVKALFALWDGLKHFVKQCVKNIMLQFNQKPTPTEHSVPEMKVG